jgi:hypothetical protein
MVGILGNQILGTHGMVGILGGQILGTVGISSDSWHAWNDGDSFQSDPAGILLRIRSLEHME